jgi:hypothetical protein
MLDGNDSKGRALTDYDIEEMFLFDFEEGDARSAISTCGPTHLDDSMYASGNSMVGTSRLGDMIIQEFTTTSAVTNGLGDRRTQENVREKVTPVYQLTVNYHPLLLWVVSILTYADARAELDLQLHIDDDFAVGVFRHLNCMTGGSTTIGTIVRTAVRCLAIHNVEIIWTLIMDLNDDAILQREHVSAKIIHAHANWLLKQPKPFEADEDLMAFCVNTGCTRDASDEAILAAALFITADLRAYGVLRNIVYGSIHRELWNLNTNIRSYFECFGRQKM